MLPDLQAERQLLAIEAVSVPKMTDAARKSVFARYTRRRSGAREVRGRSLSQALREAGVPVKTVPKVVK